MALINMLSDLLNKYNLINEIILITFGILLFSIVPFEFSCNTKYVKFPEELGFTFEYPKGDWPEGWLETPVFRSSTLIEAGLLGPNPSNSENESTVKISFAMWLKLKSEAKLEAQDIISGEIQTYKDTPNFKILKQDTISLDGQSGHLVEYTYDYDTRACSHKSHFMI